MSQICNGPGVSHFCGIAIQTPSLDNSCSLFVRCRVAGPSIEMTLAVHLSQVSSYVLSSDIVTWRESCRESINSKVKIYFRKCMNYTWTFAVNCRNHDMYGIRLGEGVNDEKFGWTHPPEIKLAYFYQKYMFIHIVIPAQKVTS